MEGLGWALGALGLLSAYMNRALQLLDSIQDPPLCLDLPRMSLQGRCLDMGLGIFAVAHTFQSGLMIGSKIGEMSLELTQ